MAYHNRQSNDGGHVCKYAYEHFCSSIQFFQSLAVLANRMDNLDMGTNFLDYKYFLILLIVISDEILFLGV